MRQAGRKGCIDHLSTQHRLPSLRNSRDRCELPHPQTASMVLDYSKFDNLDVSDDDAPTPPVERYRGPSTEASAYAKRVVERQRRARAKGTAGVRWRRLEGRRRRF